MLLTIASGLIFTKIKANALKLLSNIVREFWNKWELRGMVVFSLFLQVLLIILGSRRKHSAKHWIAFLVWSTYLLANWMATVSLSTLLDSEINSGLVLFWMPFLLLHLGGPDSITAYALEDNELWLRHFLGLVSQVGMALYVYFRFRTNDALTFLAIPIMVAGIIKCGERIWILWSASSRQFGKSLFSASAPKHESQSGKSKNFVKDITPANSTGVDLSLDPKTGSNFLSSKLFPYEEGGSSFEEPEDLEFYLHRKGIIPQSMYLHEAYLSYKMFIPLFSNLTLRFYKDSIGIFMTLKHKSTAEAFKVVETELGFLYDVLYTKLTILHSLWGSILRFTCFLSYISALLAFLFIIGNYDYHTVDITVSYLLLAGAIFLDIYGAIAHVISNWTMLWLTNYNKGLAISAYLVIASLYDRIYRKMESRYMAQHNLIEFSLEAKATKSIRVGKILDFDSNILGKYRHTTWKDEKLDVRDRIYSYILEKFKRYEDGKFKFEYLKRLLDERGDHVLKEVYELDFSETTSKVEFGHSLLVWHIATDLSYHDDLNKYSDTGILETNGKISKCLSNYLLYLLVMRPGMMPKGITEVRYHDSCAEAMRLFQDGRNLDSSKGRMILIDLPDPDARVEIPELSDKSVLFDGVRLARKLQSLLKERNWDLEEKWEMISKVWVEMLTYAASHCEWKEHCQQLRRGGELLTQVCLLMAHFGLSPQIRFEDSPYEELKSPWNWDSLNNSYYLA